MVREEAGYLLYSTTYVSGQGEIGRSFERKYNNRLTVTTITCINKVPEMQASLIKSSIQEGEYGTVYTYTFASGQGEIGSTSEKKYNGKLTITTKTSLNSSPDTSGYVFKTDVVQNEYGIIYTYSFASGSGEIAEVTTSKYNEKLLIKAITYLNDPNPTTPDGYVLINTDSNDGDYGTVVTYTYAKGSGQISYNTENRNDGSIVKTYVYLGEEETPPEENDIDYYLLEQSVQAAEGYDIYTYYYYKKPSDYDVDVETTWNKPSYLAWDREQGFHIGTVGSMDSISATSKVTFSDESPSGIPISDLSVSCVAREQVKYKDGTRLVRSTVFTNTYHDDAGSTVTNGEYIGTEVSSGTVSSYGQSLPTGKVTLGWESVPYFYAGGTTIWKTTHTTASL
jgi:hypothetical protein